MLEPNNPMCPKVVYQAYFEKMGFTKLAKEFQNCRIATKKGVQTQKPRERLSFTTLIENSKKFLAKSGLTGNFSEKSIKVSKVSGAFIQGISMEDVSAGKVGQPPVILSPERIEGDGIFLLHLEHCNYPFWEKSKAG